VPEFREITVDGVIRRFGLRFPNPYNPNVRYPIVFVFHGDLECELFDENAGRCVRSRPDVVTSSEGDFGFRELLRADAIVVYPDGANLNRFAPASLSWDSFGELGDNLDFDMVLEITAQLRQEVCTDADGPAFVAFSGGGFFAQSYACYVGGVSSLVVLEAGFEDNDVTVSRSVDNVVDLEACVAESPPALVVHSLGDLTVPVRYGDVATEHWRTVNGCATTTTTSLLDPECVEFSGCDGRVVRCTPACVDLDFDDDDDDGDVTECVSDQHRLWKPEGPVAASQFLRRFFNAAPEGARAARSATDAHLEDRDPR
jgi:hypothetical protein